MKVTLESSNRLVSVAGVLCRIWQGQSAAGIACVALIPVIAADRAEDQKEFERDLIAHDLSTTEVEERASGARQVL